MCRVGNLDRIELTEMFGKPSKRKAQLAGGVSETNAKHVPPPKTDQNGCGGKGSGRVKIMLTQEANTGKWGIRKRQRGNVATSCDPREIC